MADIRKKKKSDFGHLLVRSNLLVYINCLASDDTLVVYIYIQVRGLGTKTVKSFVVVLRLSRRKKNQSQTSRLLAKHIEYDGPSPHIFILTQLLFFVLL